MANRKSSEAKYNNNIIIRVDKSQYDAVDKFIEEHKISNKSEWFRMILNDAMNVGNNKLSLFN